MMISPDQIRAARALLRLERKELARRAHVSVADIRSIETPGGPDRVVPEIVNGVCRTLEQAGVEFIVGGVRRKNEPPLRAATLYDELRAISCRSAERLRGSPGLTDTELYDDHGLPA